MTMTTTTMVKKPSEMTLDELLDAERAREPVTEEESMEQMVSIALAEARLAGDDISTEEDMRRAIKLAKAEA